MAIALKTITFLTTLISAIKVAENTYLCPIRSSEPVRSYGTKCYQFVVHRQITWNEARENCHREGGRLATVENIGVQAFLYNSLRKIGYGGEGVWIGLTDGGHEGKFTWDSGQPVTFQYWASGQPGIGASLEDCVLFKTSDGAHGHWHDRQCSDILFLHEDREYICEFHMIQITTPKMRTTTVTTEMTTTVPQSTTKPTTKLITKRLTTRRPAVHTTPTTAEMTTGLSTSTTKVPTSTKSATNLVTVVNNTQYQCPIRSSEPVRAYGTKCYEFVVHKQRTWNEARTNCHRQGGRLATVENIGVQAFLYNALRSISYRGEGVWIGLTDAGHGGFVWDSDQPVTFTYWANNQPDGVGASLDDCVLFKMSEGGDGHWYDYKCDAILLISEDHNYVCEFHMIPLTTPRTTPTVHTTVATTVTTTEASQSTTETSTATKSTIKVITSNTEKNEAGCASGWEQNRGYCFYFSNALTGTWFDVSNYCKAFGAILAETTDQDNQLFLRNTVQSKAKGHVGFFVGGTDIFNEGSWVWVSNMTQINTHNMTYKDTDAGDNEDSDCLILRSDGYFTDYTCSSKLPYICQRRTPGSNILIG